MKRQKGNPNQEEKINKVLTSDKRIVPIYDVILLSRVRVQGSRLLFIEHSSINSPECSAQLDKALAWLGNFLKNSIRKIKVQFFWMFLFWRQRWFWAGTKHNANANANAELETQAGKHNASLWFGLPTRHDDKPILIHSQQGRSRSRNRICCRTCNNAMIQVTSQEINWN